MATPTLARRSSSWALVIILAVGLAGLGASVGAYVYPIFDEKAWEQRDREQTPNYLSKMHRMYHELYIMRRYCERLINLRQRYGAVRSGSWRHAAPRDAYGLAAGWSEAMNGGFGGTNVVANAQERISYDSRIYGLSAGQRRGFGVGQAHVQNSAVSADLMDNSVREAMRVLGQYRLDAEQIDRQLVELQRDVTDEGNQERDQLLQKAAIARVMAAAQARWLNRLLCSRVEQQALAAQRLRDQKARGLATAVYGLKAGPGLWNFTKNPDIRTAVRY